MKERREIIKEIFEEKINDIDDQDDVLDMMIYLVRKIDEFEGKNKTIIRRISHKNVRSPDHQDSKSQ